MYWVLGTGKLSNSGFFPCLLLSAERQAHGPLVFFQFGKNHALLLANIMHPLLKKTHYHPKGQPNQ
jgi:hypothetical protein